MARRFQAEFTTLSVHRAFVVHLGPASGLCRRRFRGRVEHLSSGRTAQFSSLRGLLEFFAAVDGGSGVADDPTEPPRARRPGR